MEITVEGPSFYDPEDENLFFECLSNLQGIDKVVGHGTKLTIQFVSPISKEATIRLLVICRRWDIPIEPLIKFKERTNDCQLWDNPIELENT